MSQQPDYIDLDARLSEAAGYTSIGRPLVTLSPGEAVLLRNLLRSTGLVAQAEANRRYNEDLADEAEAFGI